MYISCSTTHLSCESLFATDYAKNRSHLVLSQARGFSLPLAASSLIWLILPDGCLCATSQHLLQSWSVLLSVMDCSVEQIELACMGWLLETSLNHLFGWDAEQRQGICQGVFPQRNKVLRYLNWTISSFSNWPLRVTNGVENSFTEVIWLTNLCSQVAEWGLLWPLPLSLPFQHSFWDLSFLAAAYMC